MIEPSDVLQFARNDEIHAEGRVAAYVFKIASGSARSVRMLSDGRRLISGFHLPGDVFGLERGPVYRYRAEAIADCTVMLMPRSDLESRALHEAGSGHELWRLTSAELERAQAQMLLLGRGNAMERVSAFLLDMASRNACRRSLDLPMPRADIADYLGLTMETVSRTLTRLERSGIIALRSSRRIDLNDLNALAEMNL